MGTLVGIALLAGMVTAISPCVLPVLPVVFAGSATGSRRRPYLVVLGLVVSFTLFTLTATAILRALGLPGDTLRWLAIAIVVAMGLSLVVPQLGELVERPFARLARGKPVEGAGGFVLGLSLGLLFTPCAGPVIATVAAVAATETWSWRSVVATLAYALGAGVVLLALSLLARRGVAWRGFRAHAPRVRQGLGVLMLGVAVVFALDLDARLATQVPGYTRALQGLEESAAADRQLEGLLEVDPGAPSFNRAGAEGRLAAEADADASGPEPAAEPELEDYGAAPDFAGVAGWLNSAPLDLASLRGRVVLIDFWTYSCVNCLRTLPYLRRWDDAYRADGLTIVGVHTPEFAFERDAGNVRDAVADLGLRYPVALDPDYGTWNAWGNRYWPAKYLIDREGHVRFAHFGEGDYGETEAAIRALLAEPGLPAPVSGEVADMTPNGPQTPESYLGYQRLGAMQGGEVAFERDGTYTYPEKLEPDAIAFGGVWRIEAERAVAGAGARLGLRYAGTAAHLVLGPPGSGSGTVEVRVDGGPPRTIAIDAYRLYTLADTPLGGDEDGYHELELRFSPGVAGYAFTFGALGG